MRSKTMVSALALYKELAGSVTTIIDVGVQAYTPNLIEAFPECHHYLFEPLSMFYDDINNYYANISHTLIPKAMSDNPASNQKMTMWGVIHNGEYRISGGQLNYWDTTDPTVNVDVSTLDEYFSEEKINLDNFNSILKIDVDSVEYEILQGGSQIVLPKVGLIIIECRTDSLTKLVLMAEAQGFEIWDIVSRCYYMDQFVQCDVLLINSQLKNTNSKFTPTANTPGIEFSLWDDND